MSVGEDANPPASENPDVTHTFVHSFHTPVKTSLSGNSKIREFDDENRDVPIIHQASNVTETLYEYSNFVEGEEYVWTVFAVDDLGFSSESSSDRDLRIGTTKFLAFMLFNDWEVPFLLLGVMMVVALQAGVFLAREEKDD